MVEVCEPTLRASLEPLKQSDALAMEKMLGVLRTDGPNHTRNILCVESYVKRMKLIVCIAKIFLNRSSYERKIPIAIAVRRDGYSAIAVGAIDFDPAALKSLDRCRRRVAEEIVATHGDNRYVRRHGVEERLRCSVCGAVMTDLEDVGAYIIVSSEYAFLGLRAGIARE